MTDAELLQAIEQILDKKLEPIKEDIGDIKEQLHEMDESIGIIAEWADKVADITRTPFASGGVAK